MCGRSMIANISRGKKNGTRGKDTFAYTCKYSKKQFGPSCTFTRQFKQEYIDRDVIEVISRAAHSDMFEERVYEMLNEFQEKFDTYDSARQKEILPQLVDSVEINADANPKNGEMIVKRVRFKCPVSFYPTLPKEAYGVLGIDEFNRMETTEYVPGGNSRVDESHDECCCVLSRVKV